jgi:transcriptional antiterminator RfaH
MAYHDHADSWFLAQLKPNCAHIADRNHKQQGFRECGTNPQVNS